MDIQEVHSNCYEIRPENIKDEYRATTTYSSETVARRGDPEVSWPDFVGGGGARTLSGRRWRARRLAHP